MEVGGSSGSVRREGKRPRQQEVDREGQEQKMWERKINEWGFTCERQVDIEGMESLEFVRLIRQQGLGKFFLPIEGYKPKAVRAFYGRMTVDLSTATITSRVGDATVTVTPGLIADYLQYRRPGPPPYVYQPLEGEEFAEYLGRVLDRIADGDEEAFDGRQYVPGLLTNSFRALNKILHHNIAPFSSEKRPTPEDGDLLYVFGRPGEERCDWALFIWREMERFRRSGMAKKNIPYPAMVTVFCELAGVRFPDDRIVPGQGPFNQASYRKSSALSRPGRPETVSSQRPVGKTGQARIEEWMEILVRSMEGSRLRDEQQRLRI